MKSKKAQEFIKSETYHHVGFEAWTADILHISDAEKAVELAEAEMREWAIKSFMFTCEHYRTATDRCDIDNKLCEVTCKEKRCLHMTLYIEKFDNLKTEQI